MITRLGYTVVAAKDGIEAMEMFAQHQGEICCVVSDLAMPRMNGWQTLVALRRLSPGIPVILSSGYDEAHFLSQGNYTHHKIIASKIKESFLIAFLMFFKVYLLFNLRAGRRL